MTAAASSSVTLRNIWAHPDAHPIALDTLLIQQYGAGWLDWEPETWATLITRDFGQSISDLNVGKVHACKTLHLVDTYWAQWEVFVWCTMPFNSVPADFEHLQVPTVAQVLVSLDAADRIRTDVAFSEEVKVFIAEVHRHDGIAVALPPAASLVELKPGDFGMTPGQEAAVRAAWTKREIDSVDPTVREQLARLQTVSTYLDESRARLDAQLRHVTNAR